MKIHVSPLIADAATDLTIPLVLAKARRAVNLYSNLLQAILANHGHEIDLDSIEYDPATGWLICYRARDPMTIAMLHDIAAGDPAPSDPAELSFLISQVFVGEFA